MPRLVQITDTHIYAEAGATFAGIDTRASLATVLGVVRARHAASDALLVTGDLAMDGSDGAYRHLAAALAAGPAPLVCVPGNHDDPAALARTAPSLHRALPAVIECGCWRLLCLDTRVAGQAGGALGAMQLDWLAAALADSPAYAGLVMHHPPLAVDSPWLDPMGLADAAALWSVCAGRASLRFALCGHIHQNVDRHHAGVRVMATPSTCVQFAPRATRYAVDARHPGYRVIDLADDGSVSSTVERVPLSPRVP